MKKLIIIVLLCKSVSSFSQNSINVSLGGSAPIVYGIQTYTSGATVTISDGANWLIFNPATVQSTVTITLPANPTNMEEVTISFGGTITNGNNVVTALTIAPNSGQSIVQNFSPTSFIGGESVTYKMNISTNKWYAK